MKNNQIDLAKKPNMSSEIERIAKEYFRVETMDTRRSDGLDFYDVAIWNIKSALTAAYMAGACSTTVKDQPGAVGDK